MQRPPLEIGSVVARRFEAVHFEQMGRVGVGYPDHVPHATEYVQGMIDLIAELAKSKVGDPAYADGFGRLDYRLNDATAASLHGLLENMHESLPIELRLRRSTDGHHSSLVA